MKMVQFFVPRLSFLKHYGHKLLYMFLLWGLLDTFMFFTDLLLLIKTDILEEFQVLFLHLIQGKYYIKRNISWHEQ